MLGFGEPPAAASAEHDEEETARVVADFWRWANEQLPALRTAPVQMVDNVLDAWWLCYGTSKHAPA